MSSDRSILEREMQRVEVRPFTLEGFQRRHERKHRNRRIGAAVVALAVVAAGTGGLIRALSSDPIPATDPRHPFLGGWFTTDADGSRQTLTIEASGDDALEIEVHDERASECSGGPSTMTGTGRVGRTELVIPSPELTCDDGSEPEASSSGLPLLQRLHNLAYVFDPATDALTDSLGLVWQREGVRANREVLEFTGTVRWSETGEMIGEPGDLVAVNPETGEERVLVEDLDAVYSARWSADGRWVAYETPGPEGVALWVLSASLEPRRVATGMSMLAWSPTGAVLAATRLSPSVDLGYGGATLSLIDPATGETTDVGSIPEGTGEVTSAPVWSPDGTRFVFGARGGELQSLDARTGAISPLVQLPAGNLDSVDQIAWSPDGAHIAVMNDLMPDGGRLYVLRADGSNLRVVAGNYDPAGLAWSPDGTRLAYAEGQQSGGGLWVASSDGSAPTRLGDLPENPCPLTCEPALVWSPDGSRIAFATSGEGSGDAWAIDADGRSDFEPIDEVTYRSWDGGSYY